MAPPYPAPASCWDPGASLRALGELRPLPGRYTLHPLDRRSCPHRALLAQVDRSPTSPVPASCALYNRPPKPALLLDPRGQLTVRLPPPAAGSHPACSLARPPWAPSQVDQSRTPPLSASWDFYSRDQRLALPGEPMDRMRQSLALPVPRCYAVYAMDSSGPFLHPGPQAGQSPAPPLPRNYALYSLERTLFSHLDPLAQPGRGAPSGPVSCAIYSMASACSSPEALAQPAPGCAAFPPLLLAVYSAGQGRAAPHLELLSQIDRSCTPPLPASCAIYSRDASHVPSPGRLS